MKEPIFKIGDIIRMKNAANPSRYKILYVNNSTYRIEWIGPMHSISDVPQRDIESYFELEENGVQIMLRLL